MSPKILVSHQELEPSDMDVALRDAGLRTAVTDRLRSCAFPALRMIRLDIVDGNVTLTGGVQNFHQKQIGLTIVRSVPGVRSVRNELTVR